MLNKTDYILMLEIIYLERYLKGTVGDSSDLIRDILRVTKNSKDETFVIGEDLSKIFINLINNFLETPLEEPIDKNVMISSIESAFPPEVKLNLDNSFREYPDDEMAKNSLLTLRRMLRVKLVKLRFKFMAYNLYKTASKEIDNMQLTDIKKLALNFEEDMNNTLKSISGDDKAITDELSSDSIDSFKETMESLVEEEEGNVLFKFGWKGVNRIYQGGGRRGEMSVITALEHNYKSGFTHSLFDSVLEYNKPFPTKGNKKPMAVHLSFEDPTKKILATKYEMFKLRDGFKHEEIDILKDEKATEYVLNKLTKNGFAVRILRVDPNEWTYKDLYNYFLGLESQGYEIQLCLIDYLAMLPTTGCRGSGGNGTDLLELFRRVKNFFAKRDTVFITPHQTSPDAQDLLRGGLNPLDFVNEVANRGYYKTTRQLGQELDFGMFIHIVEYKGRAYLTMKRGKHRLHKNLPERYRYYVLPFPQDEGMIPWDLHLECEIGTHSKNIQDIEKLHHTCDGKVNQETVNIEDELAKLLAE